MIAHAKAAKVGKGGLVIWDGLLVCGPTSSRMRGTSKGARNGRVGMGIPHSRDTSPHGRDASPRLRDALTRAHARSRVYFLWLVPKKKK